MYSGNKQDETVASFCVMLAMPLDRRYVAFAIVVSRTLYLYSVGLLLFESHSLLAV